MSLCLLVSAPAPASTSPKETRPQLPAAVEFRQRVFTREQGLPDNRVLSLMQSRDGFLWVGTASGVARFDGLRFEVFGPDSYPEFVNDECTALAEGLDGAIWIGTKDGLLCLHGNHLRRFTGQDGLLHKRIHSLCVARNGDVWIGTDQGMNRLRGGRMEAIPPPADVNPDDWSARGLYEDASCAVWMALGGNVNRWEPQTDQISSIAIRNPASIVHITGDQHTNIWLKGGSLIHWQNGSPTQLLHVAGEAAFARSRDGSLWFDRDVGRVFCFEFMNRRGV